MSVNPFTNSTKALPKTDAQILRVAMDELEIGGRKSNLPSETRNSKLAIGHVGGSTGSGSGG
jgi:hypothetical protein